MPAWSSFSSAKFGNEKRSARRSAPCPRACPSFKSRTAVRTDTQARIKFEVTHPFHPWRGQRFVLSTRKQNWGEDRVMFYDAQGRLRSLPASWTDVNEADLFSQVAAGRSFSRPDDLSALASLIDRIKSRQEE
ncbi:DUF5372 family protein [Sinorhizobium medicae]|uniref:DUF5372 family protein n=1 Tax=Sinorhizobium medicae TaxID=110321 RepID=UPI0023545524|nr:DUF5372 family protein [Sinorhizobium medicae]